jgi:hypothetical protein
MLLFFFLVACVSVGPTAAQTTLEFKVDSWWGTKGSNITTNVLS